MTIHDMGNMELMPYANLLLNHGGNLGIGTSDPKEKLQIGGSIPLTYHNGSTKALSFNAYYDASNALFLTHTGGDHVGQFNFDPNTSSLHIRTSKGLNTSLNGEPVDWNEGFVLTQDGRLGVGMMTPQYTVDVDGDMRAEQITVEVVSGADYVFDDDYDLRPLDEVARYVRQHRHLPGVAPAAEMKAEGVEVGAFQMTLLEKVEELTLYLIELQQENEALKARVAALEQQ